MHVVSVHLHTTSRSWQCMPCSVLGKACCCHQGLVLMTTWPADCVLSCTPVLAAVIHCTAESCTAHPVTDLCAAQPLLSGNLILCEPTLTSREGACARLAAETGATFIPPYDYGPVMAGQGTIGLELLQQVMLGQRQQTGVGSILQAHNPWLKSRFSCGLITVVQDQLLQYGVAATSGAAVSVNDCVPVQRCYRCGPVVLSHDCFRPTLLIAPGA